jgi:hypothetical protein
MYDRSGPGGDATTAWATQKLEELQCSFPAAKEFWDYVKEQWLPKVHMWVVGYRNLPYAGQDTNAAVESYHSYMKSVLKAERTRMVGRRVDWCIHVLTGDVLTHYWYLRFQKEGGFRDNSKERGIVVSALILARDIPDADVTLPMQEGGPAYVTSTTHRHLRYVVHNPGDMWATCTCLHAQRGNTCKHKVKVLRLLYPELAEGTVARYCGTLKGTAAASIRHLLTPVFADPADTDQSRQATTPDASPRVFSVPSQSERKTEDLYATLTVQARNLLDFVEGNETLMEHLQGDFHRLLGKMNTLAAEIETGVIHPSKTTPVFHRVQDGMGMGLGRLKDMLERSRRPPVYRRLGMGGNFPTH